MSGRAGGKAKQAKRTAEAPAPTALKKARALPKATKDEPWDVRGRWVVTSKEADDYRSDRHDHRVAYEVHLNGDGEDVLWGAFDLQFLEGHMKCSAPRVSALQPTLRLVFGSRETGEGEISDRVHDAPPGHLTFSHGGRQLSGLLKSTFGNLKLEGRRGASLDSAPSVRLPLAELKRGFKQYTERRHRKEGAERWGGYGGESSSEEDDGHD